MISWGGRARPAWAALASLALILSNASPGVGQPPTPHGEEGGTEPEPLEAVSAWEEISLKAVDAVLVRPLGAVATAAGAAFFVISVPLVAASGGIRESWEFFVIGPVDYTFVRPLGDL